MHSSRIKHVETKGLVTVTTFVDDFVAFIRRGKVVDLAVGLIVGTAFSAVVLSVVNDIIGPFIALATPQSGLENMFIVLRYNSLRRTYSTLEEANKVGVVTWNYGKFLSTVINFLIVALVVYVIVRLITIVNRKLKAAQAVCPKCKEDVKGDAVRCPHCTSDILMDDHGGLWNAPSTAGQLVRFDIGRGMFVNLLVPITARLPPQESGAV